MELKTELFYDQYSKTDSNTFGLLSFINIDIQGTKKVTLMIPAIEIKDLTVAYDEKPVLWDIDLTIPQGLLVAIVGPNGAGKTTLLKSALGLIKPAAGQVRILGQPFKKAEPSGGYVPNAVASTGIFRQQFWMLS